MSIGLEDVLPKKQEEEVNEEPVKEVESAFDEYARTHADKDGNIEVKDSKGRPTKISVETLKQAPDIEAHHIATIENTLASLDKTIYKFEKIKEDEEKEQERQDALNNRVVTEDVNYEVKDDEITENVNNDNVRESYVDSNLSTIDKQDIQSVSEEESDDVIRENVLNEESSNTVPLSINDEETTPDIEDNIIRRDIPDAVENIIEADDIPEPEAINQKYSDYIKENKKKKKKKVIDLNSIKIKKSDKKNKDFNKSYTNIVNDIKNRNVCREVLGISGYIVNMAGLSSIELRNIENTLSQMENNSTTFEVLEYKYRIAYELISKSTLGKLTFMQFLKNTAMIEFDIIMHGVYGATHGNIVSFPRTCPKCGLEYVCNINTKDMLYVSKEDREEYDKMYNDVMKTGMLKVPTLLNRVDNVILEDCGIIVGIRQPTLYNQLYDISKNITNEEQEKSTLMSAMPFIKEILVEDSSDGTYIKITDFDKIFNILSKSLTEDDDATLAEAVMKRIQENKVKFVTKIPKCPNEKCDYIPKDRVDAVSMESMVFLVHQMKLLMKE